mmetsp:Transcript_63802/g.120847  ORF Transcript_63802/g.120847 Transcript_63802/m.120847 type:complete len:420 (-) Transcript_63802:106-1365(-)
MRRSFNPPGRKIEPPPSARFASCCSSTCEFPGFVCSVLAAHKGTFGSGNAGFDAEAERIAAQSSGSGRMPVMRSNSASTSSSEFSIWQAESVVEATFDSLASSSKSNTCPTMSGACTSPQRVCPASSVEPSSMPVAGSGPSSSSKMLKRLVRLTASRNRATSPGRSCALITRRPPGRSRACAQRSNSSRYSGRYVTSLPTTRSKAPQIVSTASWFVSPQRKGRTSGASPVLKFSVTFRTSNGIASGTSVRVTRQPLCCVRKDPTHPSPAPSSSIRLPEFVAMVGTVASRCCINATAAGHKTAPVAPTVKTPLGSSTTRRHRPAGSPGIGSTRCLRAASFSSAVIVWLRWMSVSIRLHSASQTVSVMPPGTGSWEMLLWKSSARAAAAIGSENGFSGSWLRVSPDVVAGTLRTTGAIADG